jgi:hypothetical protein
MNIELLIYQEEYDTANSIDNFMSFYYNLTMNFLASDLLERGFSPKQISDAVLKAIKVGKSSGLEVRKHFMPVFTDVNKEIISDCKLSDLGYGLVLLNADVELSVVGEWQIKVLESYIN